MFTKYYKCILFVLGVFLTTPLFAANYFDGTKPKNGEPDMAPKPMVGYYNYTLRNRKNLKGNIVAPAALEGEQKYIKNNYIAADLKHKQKTVFFIVIASNNKTKALSKFFFINRAPSTEEDAIIRAEKSCGCHVISHTTPKTSPHIIFQVLGWLAQEKKGYRPIFIHSNAAICCTCEAIVSSLFKINMPSNAKGCNGLNSIDLADTFPLAQQYIKSELTFPLAKKLLLPTLRLTYEDKLKQLESTEKKQKKQISAILLEKNNLATQCDRLATQKNSLQNNYDNLNRDKDKLQKECTKLKKQVKLKIENNTTLESQKKQLAAKCDLLTTQKNSLQNNYDNLNRDKDNLQKECTKLTNEVKLKIENNTTLKSQKNKLAAKCDLLTKQKNNLQKSYNDLKNTKKHLKNNYDNLNREKDNLQDNYNVLENSYDNLTTQKDALVENNRRLKKEKKRNCTLFSILLPVVLTISSVVQYSFYNSLQKSYKKLDNNYNSLKNVYSSLNNRYNNLDDDYSSLKKSYKYIENDYNSLKNGYSSLNDSYNDIGNNYTILNNSYNSLNKSYNKLDNDYNILSNSYNNDIGNNYNILKSILKDSIALPYSPLTGHTSSVRSVAISSDNRYIVSGSWGKTIRIWDLKTGQELSYSHKYTIYSVSISSDNKYIFSFCDDETIRIWDIKTGQEVSSQGGYSCSYDDDIRISSDNRYIVSGSYLPPRIWDLKTGKELPYSSLYDDKGEVNSVAISSRNNYKASVGGGFRVSSNERDCTIRIWDLKTGKEVSYSPLNGDKGEVSSVAISSDNTYIVSVSKDSTIFTWEFALDGRMLNEDEHKEDSEVDNEVFPID